MSPGAAAGGLMTGRVFRKEGPEKGIGGRMR